MRTHHHPLQLQPHGVSLVELVIVLAIVGVIGSLGATLVSRIATEQQAIRGKLVLAQSLDGALSQLHDQLQQAVPNSLRLTANADGSWIEWVPVRDAGVARLAPDTAGAGTGDPLDLDDPADSSFDVVGVPLAALSGAAWLVWQNLGTPDADAYAGNNRRAGLVVAAGGRQVSFTPAGALPVGTGSGRFFVAGAPITLACRPDGSGGWQLLRYSGYGWQASQPAAPAAFSGAAIDTMATGLGTCAAAYSAALANIGLLVLRLGAAEPTSGDQMLLVQQVAVDNAP